MIAVVTFVAAMTIFLAGVAAIASGCRNEFKRRSVEAAPEEEDELMSEIEEWLRQQQ
ncbi:MAG TPA: hypothetical protein VFH58_07275 [Acidimicrobiales bacterium]|nr:hypothetical protein [Acidimicrobiales bacterium]